MVYLVHPTGIRTFNPWISSTATLHLLLLDMNVLTSEELMENLLFTLADFEVKMLFGIGFEISKASHKYGQYQPKVGKDWNFLWFKWIQVRDIDK